ncbi:UNVERIFIED_CONTAM: hypothetical protein FKN15_002884 [Acipenser sinensis]
MPGPPGGVEKETRRPTVSGDVATWEPGPVTRGPDTNAGFLGAKRCPKLQQGAKPPAQAPHPSGSTLPPGPSKRPAEGGKKGPAPLPVTSEGGKGEKAPEAAGPSAPPESARGEKAAEWTVVARRKKKAAARSTGAAEQRATKPATAPSGGGSGGVPEKGTPSKAPPVRLGGKAARKTKHLIPTEGEERSAAGAPCPSGSTPPPGPSKRPAEGGKKAPAPLPVTSGGERGEKAPEAAGPSAPPESARGEKAAEWTTVVRRKKKAAARSTGAAKQGATKPTAAPSGGGSGGVPEKGTPSTAPPARQGGKAARKTKHLIPTEGEGRSAAGGELPVAETRQGTASGSLRGKRNAQACLPTCARKCTRLGLLVRVPGGAIEGPPKRKRPPRHPPSTGTATEGEKDPSPEAVQGSAEAAEPMEEAPTERPKGREEPVRAEIALRVDPLPVIQETSEAGPDSTIEGPAAAEVAEAAQEGPRKSSCLGHRLPPTATRVLKPMLPRRGRRNQLPRQRRAPQASVDSADNAEPMQATPAEGPEGGKEPPQEQEPPRAPEASVGSADNAEPMQAPPAEGPEGEEELPLPEQELPQASLSCGDGGSGPRTAAEGDKITPPEADVGPGEPTLTLVSGARKGGEEPERTEGGAVKVDPLPEVQRGQETGPRPSIEGPVPVTEGAREEPLKQLPPRASLSGGGEGSGPCAAVGGKHRPRRSR